MVKLLSSMRFAFWLIVSMIAWLILGALLAINDGFYHALKAMSSELILDWLFTKGANHGLLLFWFIVLCVIGALLAVSFVFCTWNTLVKSLKKKTSGKSLLMFYIHILFALILGMHLCCMIFGYKHSNVKLEEGESFVFGDGYAIELLAVDYVDDVEVLRLGFKEMRKHQTSEDFHYNENRASIRLTKKGLVVAEGEAVMLSPFRQGSLRVTITSFYMPKDFKSETPGVSLVIAKNDLVGTFFILYALGILSIVILLIITWKRK